MEHDAEIHSLCGIPDPADRAKVASDLASKYQAAMIEVSRVRREALDELVTRGMTHAEIAAKIGTTRARVTQLLTSGPRPERAFLGAGLLTVAIGGKIEQGRADNVTQPLVSTEAIKAYEVLSALAGSLSLQTQQEVVPPPGHVDLNRANLIVLTSPRLLPFVGQVLAADLRYGFVFDQRGLYLVDRQESVEYRPPQDVSGEPCDYGYLGRLPRPDGRGTFLYLAGVHAMGTLGVARYLEANLDVLYRDLKTRRFSMLVRSQFDPVTRSIVSATALTPVHRHEGV